MGHVRRPCGKEGGEIVWCRGTAVAGGTAGARDGGRSGLGAQGLSVHIPGREQARLPIIGWFVCGLGTDENFLVHFDLGLGAV